VRSAEDGEEAGIFDTEDSEAGALEYTEKIAERERDFEKS